LFEYLFGWGYAPVRGKLFLKDAFHRQSEGVVIHIAHVGFKKCQGAVIASDMTGKRPFRPLHSEKASEV
jgi:hypothetical protein